MSVIREIKFHELEEGMVVEIGSQGETYIVDRLTIVSQAQGHIEALLVSTKDNNMWVTADQLNFDLFPKYYVGKISENDVEWPTPPTQQESISEPDPTTHDSYIQAIVVDGEKMELGRTVGAGEVTQIKKVLGTEKNVFVFLNKNGAVLGEFHVGGHSDLSIVYGFREMEGEG